MVENPLSTPHLPTTGEDALSAPRTATQHVAAETALSRSSFHQQLRTVRFHRPSFWAVIACRNRFEQRLSSLTSRSLTAWQPLDCRGAAEDQLRSVTDRRPRADPALAMQVNHAASGAVRRHNVNVKSQRTTMAA